MKKLYLYALICVICTIFVIFFVNDSRKHLKIDLSSSVIESDFTVILDDIVSKNGNKYGFENNYLINHWSSMFIMDIYNNGLIKRMTISLALEKKDGKYDIYQIRKAQDQNLLYANLVDEIDSFSKLNNPVKAEELLSSLNNINWINLLSKMPEAEFYTLKSWGVYKKGESIDTDSGALNNLHPKTTYICNDNMIIEFNDYNEILTNETVLIALANMNQTTNGYKGSADLALLLELPN